MNETTLIGVLVLDGTVPDFAVITAHSDDNCSSEQQQAWHADFCWVKTTSRHNWTALAAAALYHTAVKLGTVMW